MPQKSGGKLALVSCHYSPPTIRIFDVKGLFRYGRMRLLPDGSTLLRVGMLWGLKASLVRPQAGRLPGSTSAEALNLLLGLILTAGR